VTNAQHISLLERLSVYAPPKLQPELRAAVDALRQPAPKLEPKPAGDVLDTSWREPVRIIDHGPVDFAAGGLSTRAQSRKAKKAE
jgi:hypothetical protein